MKHFEKNRLTIFGAIEFSRSRLTNTSYSPRYLGGNGILASLAAGRHVPVDFVGVIGTDMSRAKVKRLLGKNITIENILQVEGKSFDYGATYDAESFELVDEEIDFGIYGSCEPRLFTTRAKEAKHLFCGSSPRFGLAVLKQMVRPEVIGVNTLLYHLKNNREYSIELMGKATHLFVSSKEYEYITKELNYKLFSPEKPLQYVFKTEGTKGIEVITPTSVQRLPVPRVVKPLDPINAGDVLAGAIMGMIAKGLDIQKNLKEIVVTAQEEAIKVILNDTYYRRIYTKE